MSDWKNMFPTGVSITRTTTAPIVRAISNLDLRAEFISLMFGRSGETPIGQTYIFRRMRRDSNEDLVPCVCLDPTTKEANRDFPCPYCVGVGFLWDEEFITGYKVVASAPGGSNAAANLPKSEVGHIYLPAIRFFFPYDLNPERNDRIIEVDLDSEGDLVVPYKRTGIYEIQLVRAMRSDNSKIEFWICSTQKLGPETLGTVG